MAGDITTIARPYAEAVFSRGQESGQLDAWGDALSLLSAVAGNPDMASQISNPNIPRDRLRDVVLQVGGETLPAEAQNLVKLLAANNRLSTLPEIARLFDELKTQHEGLRQVRVLSAFALSESEQKDLSDVLKARLGGEVDMMVETDPSLIGGVEIRAGDLVIDGSVRGKLRKLANELHY